MCGDSQRKHAEKCDLQRARPEPTLSMQVSDSLYLCFCLLHLYAKLHFLYVLFKNENTLPLLHCQLLLDLSLNENQKHSFLYYNQY